MAAAVTNTSRQLGAVVGIAALGSVINAQLGGALLGKLAAEGIPKPIRDIVQRTVEHGGLPPQSSVSDYPPVLRPLVQRVLDTAFASFGHGLHLCLTAAAVLLVVATAAALVVRHGAGEPLEQDDGAPALTRSSG
jgi:hypothetical protein